MKPMTNVVLSVGACVLLGAAPLGAEVRSNPYQPIIDRNAFGLKPPPPPPDNTPPPPVVLPAKVILTGITSLFGPASKRALLEITEQEPGKPPTSKKPIMQVGQREGSVEVLEIDVEKNTVKIRNGTVETNLAFEVAKSSGPAPGVPNFPPLGGINPAIPSFNPPQPHSAGATPTIISPASANPSANSGVTMFGGGSTPASASGSMGASAIPSPLGNTLGNSDGGARVIPNRTVRTQTSSQGVDNQVRDFININAQSKMIGDKGFVAPPPLPIPEGLNSPPAPPSFPRR